MTNVEVQVTENIRHSFLIISRIFFSLLFFFLSASSPENNCHSQVIDSISNAFKKRPGLTGGFATKTTFINGFQSPIYTARLGLDFNSTIRLGGGFSLLRLSAYKPGNDNTPFYLDKIIIDTSGSHWVHPKLQFMYVNIFIEYIYFKTRRWQFSIPIQFGIGGSSYKYNFNGADFIDSKHSILLYEPAVSGHYKLTSWFGAGLDVGYRIMIINNKNIGSKFNSPVYDFKVILFWGALYNSVFKGKD